MVGGTIECYAEPMKKLGKHKVLGTSPTLNEHLNQAHQDYLAGHFTEAAKGYDHVLRLYPSMHSLYTNLGAAQQQAGNPHAAITAFNHALRYEPSAQAYYNLAGALKEAHQLADAEANYRQALHLEPKYAQAWNNLASVLQAQGHWPEAESAYTQALTLKADYTLARYNLGLVLQHQSRWDEALVQQVAVIRQSPDFVPAYESLAESFVMTGRFMEAAALWEHLAATQPQPAGYWIQWGHCYQKQGALAQAAVGYQQALVIDAQAVEALRSLGSIALAQSDYAMAVDWFHKVLQINPNHEEAWVQMGHAYKEMGQMDAALNAYKTAYRLAPHPRHLIRMATTLPPIYQSLDEVAFWRQHFQQEVAALFKQTIRLTDPLSEIGTTNFYLAYQGHNDRQLQQLVADLYRPSLPAQLTVSTTLPKGTRKRIGLISGFFYNHSISHYYASLLTALAQAEFEIVLLAVPGMKHDEVTAQLRQTADYFQALPHHLPESRRLIAHFDLDVLLYTDIGMEPFTYFLAFTRLAPIQAVLAGHPVTTGIPTMDYFISHEITELPEAQEHYSEQLVRLPGFPVSYPRPVLPVTYKSRAELGLPAERHIYLCPMTLFKIHPDFDATIAQILTLDPLGEVMFFRYRETNLHVLLQERFSHTLAAFMERIQFLPWAAGEDFFSVLYQADVVLDSFPFGGGSTHFLSLATGTPLITWPGTYLRGRSGAAILNELGLNELIAKDPQHFAEVAVNTAQNPAKQQALRAQILAGHEHLYNNSSGVAALIRWLQDV